MLTSLLDSYFSSQELPYSPCPKCNRRGTLKRNVVPRCPPILVISLKRSPAVFDLSDNESKTTTTIECPLILNTDDFYEFTSAKYLPPPQYALFAVTDHTGASIESGHYTATVKIDETPTWIKFDDETVTRISTPVTSSTCLLFYEALPEMQQKKSEDGNSTSVPFFHIYIIPFLVTSLTNILY